LIFAGFLGSDLLLGMLYDARPLEYEKGRADQIYAFYKKQLMEQLEKAGKTNPGAGTLVSNTLSGHMFGVSAILKRAAREFRSIRNDTPMPTVLVVGELYVRCDPFANDFIIRKLEQRGIRCRFAPFTEWLEYTDYQDVVKKTIPEYLSSFLQATIQHHLHAIVAEIMGWPSRVTVQDSLEAAAPYIRQQLSGEAALTLGAPLFEWREGHIDGVVSAGPFECMPNKIAESQFVHVAEEEGLISLTLNLNGEPIDRELIDNFTYEVHDQFEKRRTGKSVPPPPIRPRPRIWRPQSLVNSRDPQ
jgi:predicted nucleotide-binding protein (sugar kinase/HSP70/actin superfamily)